MALIETDHAAGMAAFARSYQDLDLAVAAVVVVAAAAVYAIDLAVADGASADTRAAVLGDPFRPQQQVERLAVSVVARTAVQRK